jgi:hypothetical protein
MREVKIEEIKDGMKVIYAPINTSAYKWFRSHLAKVNDKYYLLEVSGVYWAWGYDRAFEITKEEVKKYFPEVPLENL